MGTIIQQWTSGGNVLVVDVNQFAAILIDRNPQVLDFLTGFAIEREIFGVKPKVSKRKKKKEYGFEITCQKDSMFQDYGQAAILSDPNNPGIYFGEDSSYVNHTFPMCDVEDDIVGCIVKQLISFVVPYPDIGIKTQEEAVEFASCQALENFVNPTHVVKLKPKLYIAWDIEDIKLKIAEIDGTIKLCVYTEKLCALKALEATNVVEL